MTLSLPTINTPVEEMPKGHCRDCRTDRHIYLRPVGDFLIWKCYECGMWIHCVECGGTKVHGHNCPSREITV